MAHFKVVYFFAMMAVCALAVPIYEEHQQVEEEHYEPAHYEFKYAVKDEHTHDIKEQYEKREGDKVEGYYSLVEPDGTVRTVRYSSDKDTGFIAHVERSGHASHPAPIKKIVPVKKVIVPVKKVIYPVKKVVYPVKYHSYEPVLQHSYSQGSSHYSSPVQSYSNEQSGVQGYSNEQSSLQGYSNEQSSVQGYSNEQSSVQGYSNEQAGQSEGSASYSSISFGGGAEEGGYSGQQ